MKKILSLEEYQKSLPKKQIGTAVVFLNEDGHILLLKPNYKKGWIVPGGSVDDGESPMSCVIRETKEEVGLSMETPELLAVYFSAAKNGFGDSLKFIFNGGILSKEDIDGIKIQNEELDEYLFLPIEKAVEILSNSLKNSIPVAIDSIGTGKVVFID
jgi:8-oxo-dGTP pyrophosphatase MutT (NUDIX family)